ncbi:MAG: peptidylprolyl isomerase [Proteobacteria bacterium]|nr:peptidylprolyl isomerase [Pseudomonadota bacterium]
MNRFVVAALLALIIIFPRISNCEIVDRVIAIVNDDLITLKELEQYVHVEKHGKYVSVNEYFRNIQLLEKIGALIDNLLIKQQAKKFKIDVSNKEIDSIINNIKKQYLITEEELKEQLKKDNVNFKDFVEGLKTNLLRSKVLSQVISPEVLVTDNNLIEFYNKHIVDYKEEVYRLRQIFISNNQKDPQNKAMTAYNQLKEGKPFESIAKEFSDDPSGLDGGDIGLVKSEDLIPELKGAVRTLTPGEYTSVIRTPYGFLILKLIETKQGETVAFETVKDKIHERIIQEESEKKYKEYINKLRKSSYIEVKI